MLQRHVFNISTDSGGDWVDTGPPIEGMVLQVAVDTGAFDTGCDFKLEGIQSRVVVLDWDNAGGSVWTRSPRIATFDTGGTEIGNQQPLFAHERLRLTVNQSEAVTGSKTAKFYVWTGW